MSDSYYDVIFNALRGECNSQPFVFKNKMAVSRFAQVSDEEISEMSFSLFFNSEIILKQLFASGSVNIYILLDVLVCSIAVYFYELCRIVTSP